MDRGAWRAIVHGVAESDMIEQLSTHSCTHTYASTCMHTHTHTHVHACTCTHTLAHADGTDRKPHAPIPRFGILYSLNLKKKCFRKPFK